MLFRTYSAATLGFVTAVVALHAADSGSSVVLIYNARLSESKSVAAHYASRRNVPAAQILGLDLPTDETMSRADYREQLQKPLLSFLQQNKLFVYPPVTPGRQSKDLMPIAAKVRYAVLCYGVPLRIAEDPLLPDPGAERINQIIRRNGAAVDSELCTLPILNCSAPLAGPLANRLYGRLDAASLDPTNGLLLVARLDGPSAVLARALVDKALDAETNGLWGRGYFDLRGLTNGPYKKGDDWIRAAADITHRFGFEAVVDDKPETFSAAFPMSQIALYAGWYDVDASGPFTRRKVEFMPGAFAYHLHSFSANTLRSSTKNWCGPLLADGATATMGCIDEPYLDGTPNIGLFFLCWLPGGFTFGEAAYACQGTVSWQTTVVGDPLYRPFGKTPHDQHDALERRHSNLIEWADLRYADESLVLGLKPAEAVQYLLGPGVPQDSAVLTEKLAELYQMEGQDELSIKALRRALKLGPTPQQRVRLTLNLSDRLIATGQAEDALALCDEFLKKSPDYPDAVGLYSKMQALATNLNQTRRAERYAREITKLTAGK